MLAESADLQAKAYAIALAHSSPAYQSHFVDLCTRLQSLEQLGKLALYAVVATLEKGDALCFLPPDALSRMTLPVQEASWTTNPGAVNAC